MSAQLSLLYLSPVVLVVVLGVHFLFRVRDYRRRIDAIGGPPVRSWLVGNLDILLAGRSRLSMRDYVRGLFAYFFKLIHEDRRGAVRLWLGPWHTIFILTSVDNIERLLSSSVNLNKGMEYRFLRPWLGQGILLAHAQKWRAQRKLLTPAFHFKMLEAFLPTFQRHTALMIAGLEKQFQEGQTETMVVDDVRPMFEEITLNIINETAMGVRLDDQDIDSEQKQANAEYREALKRTFRFVSYRTTTPSAWFDFIFRQTRLGQRFFNYVKTLHAYTDRIIAKRVAQLVELYGQPQHADFFADDHPKTKDAIFLDILLKERIRANPQHPHIEGIRSEVHTFILGGHDTTASALTCSLLLLGTHQHEQETARQQILDIVGANIDRAHGIEFGELKRMHYLELCIKETLRLYPSILLVGRHLVADLPLANNAGTIPAGHTCYVPIIALHRDARYFEKPEQFIPERFGPEQATATGRSPYAFVPFSAGPRNCIGQKYAMLEVKLVLAELLRRYRVVAITKPAEVQQEMTAVNKLSVPISIRFERLRPQPV